MRIILVTAGSLFVFFVLLLTIKFWGKGQAYNEYKHAMLQVQQAPIEYARPNYARLLETINSTKNIYLDVTVTFDQRLVIPKRKWVSTEKPLKLLSYDDVKNDVLLVVDFAERLKNRKIIFNLLENAQAIHETFIFDLKNIGMEKGENFIVTSQYEAPIKALKEIAPALVYGSTQPEILKIVAMRSMYLLEAVTIRADVIIHPLKIRNHNFFNEEILQELSRRHKKIIVGPVNFEEIEEARKIKPLAIIVNY